MAGDGAREATERPSLTLGAIAKSLAAGGIAGGVCVRRREKGKIRRRGKTRRAWMGGGDGRGGGANEGGGEREGVREVMTDGVCVDRAVSRAGRGRRWRRWSG